MELQWCSLSARCMLVLQFAHFRPDLGQNYPQESNWKFTTNLRFDLIPNCRKLPDSPILFDSGIKLFHHYLQVCTSSNKYVHDPKFVHASTSFCTLLQVFARSYKFLHASTSLCTLLHVCARFYKIVQVCARFYKFVHASKSLCTLLQVFARF
jgi:hypothetical protein